MSIKTPVKVVSSGRGRYLIVTHDGRTVGGCDRQADADALAHALNTHAALRASHAEMVKALSDMLVCCQLQGSDSMRTTQAMASSRTALSNAAKVKP